MNRIVLAITFAAVWWTASAAWADDVTIKGLPPYTGVKVTGVKGVDLLFSSATGNPIQHQLAKVVSIKLTGQDSFNEAEDDLAKGKVAEAVKAYDQAEDRAADEWMKKLVVLRRLRALDKGGMIELSTREWLVLMEQLKHSPDGLAFCPTNAAAKGSAQNARVIALLENKLSSVKEPPYAAAIKGVLAELYRVEGKTDKLKAIRGSEGTTSKDSGNGSKPPKNGSSGVPAPSSSDVSEQLRSATAMLAKDPGKALVMAEANLKHYSPSELPAALLVMGKAQMALSESQKDAREQRRLQLEAALNFMRVATFYATQDDAGEAMYLAGVISERLKNPEAARAAYEKVVSGWPDMEITAKARAALERLRKGP